MVLSTPSIPRRLSFLDTFFCSAVRYTLYLDVYKEIYKQKKINDLVVQNGKSCYIHVIPKFLSILDILLVLAPLGLFHFNFYRFFLRARRNTYFNFYRFNIQINEWMTWYQKSSCCNQGSNVFNSHSATQNTCHNIKG